MASATQTQQIRMPGALLALGLAIVVGACPLAGLMIGYGNGQPVSGLFIGATSSLMAFTSFVAAMRFLCRQEVVNAAG